MSTEAGHANDFARLWTAECGRKDPDSGEEKMRWFKLRVGTALGRFIFKANRADFLDCPRLLAGFDQHYAVLEAHTRSNEQNSDPLPDDCLAWIMPTMYTTLRDRGELFDPSERHRECTLKEFWQKPWRVFQVSAEQGRMRIEYCTTEASPNMSTWTDLPLPHLQDVGGLRGITIVPWAGVNVWHAEPRTILGDQPREVWMSGRRFYLKSFEGLDDAAGVARLIAKYEAIDADIFQEFAFPPTTFDPLNVPRTFYLVVDDEQRALGLVQTYVDRGVPLREALQSGAADADACSDDATKRAWKRALVKTLAQLHAHGIAWESVDLDSVLVSGEHAWVFHFGDGAEMLRVAGAETPAEADVAHLARLFADELWQWSESQRVLPAPDQPPVPPARMRRRTVEGVCGGWNLRSGRMTENRE
ncbi:hypothetical protein BBAD15_g6617 [Beauveria bassiana D1-5]|uniref:Protein kinase domain-containing protein n=1 Tax=Beauveria bassiana D1-5 TaxID=1245745 RepID=A0A0A2W4W6_BEABA|nr:hypothetical protein BBAD15_g6617 [Beauveria bassiana D1-5]